MLLDDKFLFSWQRERGTQGDWGKKDKDVKGKTTP